MKNKVIKILIATIFLIVIIFLLLRIKGTNKQFRNVVLSEKNLISNFVNPSYYDTILMVGLDLMKIENQSVVIRKLSESAKSQFDGELQAHLKYHEGVFYLFMNDHDREESIKILNHRISLLTGEKVWDAYELDVTETVKTVELARHMDRGDWTK